MATVTLDTLWLNALDNPSDARSFPLMSRLRVTPSAKGEIRTYANGRQRAIRTAAKPTTAEVTLTACDRDDVAWIEGHCGVNVIVRDDRGRKFGGVYFSVPTDEHQYADTADVTLSLGEISYSEAV